MSFVTVGIIRYSKNIGKGYEENIEFLVQKKGRQYSFWEFTNSAIGAVFQRDLLDRKFVDSFGIKLEEQESHKFCEREYEGEKWSNPL